MVLGANSYRLGVFMVTLIYVLQYGDITADKILPVALHLYNLRTLLGSQLFLVIKNITDMHVSVKRIEVQYSTNRYSHQYFAFTF